MESSAFVRFKAFILSGFVLYCATINVVFGSQYNANRSFLSSLRVSLAQMVEAGTSSQYTKVSVHMLHKQAVYVQVLAGNGH